MALALEAIEENTGRQLPDSVIGMGVIIYNGDGQILITRELEEDPYTLKQPGEEAIIQEKIKMRSQKGCVRESPRQTLLRALGEAVSQTDIRDVGDSFRRVTPSPPIIVPLPEIGRDGVLEIVRYDGDPSRTFSPTATTEVGAPQWKSIQSFLDAPTIRTTSRTIVTFAVNNGHIEAGEKKYKKARGRKIFPKNHSMEKAHQRWQKRKDVTVFERGHT